MFWQQETAVFFTEPTLPFMPGHCHQQPLALIHSFIHLTSMFPGPTMCHALFIHLKGKAKLMNNDFAELLFSHKVMSDSFGTPWPTRFLCPWAFPGKNTGASCHFLPQGIFLTQELNLHLLHCRQILYR